MDRSGRLSRLPRASDGRPIVCATRGGEGSRAVRQRAIALARRTGRPLVFLFVIDLASIEAAGAVIGGETMTAALHDELAWLGGCMLRIARQQAQRAGVEAEIVILEGNIKEEITRYVRDSYAARLLLGAPRTSPRSTFGEDEVERFARAVHADTGVVAEVVRPEGAGED